MASAGLELQKAVFAALMADAQLSGLISGRVFDDVPPDAAYPYMTIGESSARDWSTGTDSGDEHILTLHVWSRAAGRKEVHAIMGAVRELLHETETEITVAGHRLVNLRHEFTDARREPDGETYHGVVRYRAVTEVEG